MQVLASVAMAQSNFHWTKQGLEVFIVKPYSAVFLGIG
jgi:hypothetical protein